MNANRYRVPVLLLNVVIAIPAIVVGLVVGPIWWLVTSAWRVLEQEPTEVRIVP